MLKEERQEKILELLNEEKKVIAADLSYRFAVSEDTVRRDLKELDRKGLLKRVHKGALRLGPPVTDFEKRQNIANDKKQQLAQKALPFIKENSLIIIDGGTTNFYLAHAIAREFKATIITNSPPIATALVHHDNIEVLMTGGTLYKQSMVCLGIDTVEYLNDVRADLYIMGTHNIDNQNGISVPTLSEALVKRKMASVSAEVLTIVTEDKLGTVSNQIIGPSDILSYLITEEITPNVKNLYTQQGICVVT